LFFLKKRLQAKSLWKKKNDIFFVDFFLFVVLCKKKRQTGENYYSGENVCQDYCYPNGRRPGCTMRQGQPSKPRPIFLA